MSKKANLKELVDFNELQAIQDSFAKTLGTSSVIFSPEGEQLTQFSNPTGFCALIQSTEEGKRRCFLSFMEMCQKAQELEEPEMHYCFVHGGHFVAPIIIDGEHKGTVFAGQYIPQKFSPEQLKALEKIAVEINVDPSLLVEEAKKMRVVEEDRVWKYSSLLFQIVAVITTLGAQAAELNRAKDALQKAYNGLEIRVQERTAELVSVNEELKQEITERKKAEDAQRESNAKIRNITASAQDAIIMMDDDRTVSYWNEAAERTFGYTEEEIIGKELHTTLVPKSFYEDFLTGFETFRETGEGAAIGETLELVAVRKDGTEFPIALSLSAVKLKGKWNAIGVIRDITEQKRAETALREGKQLLRATIESTEDGFLVVNEKGQVTHSNAQFAQMWSIPEEVIKTGDDDKLLSSILDQLKDPQAFLSKVQELYKSSNKSIDTIYLKDGCIFRRFSSPLIKEGKITGRVWCFRDITERKKIREGLRKSEEKYRLLADNTLDCVWQIGLDFKFTYVNPSVLQMFGFTQEEWIGSSLSDHCSPEDMDFVSRLAKEGLKKGPEASGVTFEIRILHKNGETIDVEIVTNVMLDENKNPIGFQGTTRDISDRKRMETDLENSKQHFQMLFNHLVDPVVIIDSEGVFLAVTDRVEEITGFKREELLGRNFLQLEIVTDESKALMAENLAKRTKGQDVAPYEVEVLLKDRRKMSYEVNAALITYMGKIADMVIFRDISDRKRAEEELRKRTDDLERFNKLAVDRELVMIELKKEVNRLYERQGEKPHYDLSFLDETVLKK